MNIWIAIVEYFRARAEMRRARKRYERIEGRLLTAREERTRLEKTLAIAEFGTAQLEPCAEDVKTLDGLRISLRELDGEIAGLEEESSRMSLRATVAHE